MSTITTHVLDVALGRPASGIVILLERLGTGGGTTRIGGGTTDSDGRARDLVSSGDALDAGDYRLRFETGAYFAASGRETFYPAVTVTFRVAERGGHYHVPLLLSPFGYTTYRGS
jgi:5-hydroxyisourate hydrolase